jgi:HSP20 family protein
MVPFDNYNGGLIPSRFTEIFDALHDEMFNIFGKKNSFLNFVDKSSFPKVNVRKKDTNIVLEVAIPHYHPENVEVVVENGMLVISGKAAEDNVADGEYLVREVSKRAFTRSWQLPEGVNESQVNARYDKGVLYVEIKNITTSKPQRVVKKIEIKQIKE